MSDFQRRYLYLTVFTSGMVVLALELSASRLLGRAFGTGNIVWASVIGLTLLYLTAGYFLGGWLSERSPTPRTFFRVVCWGAFAGGLIPPLSALLLPIVADAVATLDRAVLVGSVTMMTVVLAAPVTLLGTVSPFALRLALEDTAEAGRLSGRLYAVSTVGSLLGSFLPVLVFNPLMGVTLTIFFFAGLLLIVGLGGLILFTGRRALVLAWMPVVLAVLAFVV